MNGDKHRLENNAVKQSAISPLPHGRGSATPAALTPLRPSRDRQGAVVGLVLGGALFLESTLCAEQGGAPVQDENLAYTINWPSGLSLGEAHLISHQAGERWYFEMALDTGVPGFPVSDHFRSSTNPDLCSVEFERETLHGKRRAHEKTTFDYKTGSAQRVTLSGGGKTSVRIPACARDALAYVMFARRELGQGRVPPAATVFYGAQYRVKADFIGPQNVTYNEKKAKADKLVVSLKGPASDVNVEVYFALDAARTPLAIRVPLSVGMVSMELVR